MKNNSINIDSYFYLLMLRSFTCSIVVLVIYRFGDDIIAFTRANPSESLAFIVVITYIFIESDRLANWIFHSADSVCATQQSAGVAMAAARILPTAQDHRCTSAHEAGHALVYAALEKLPADFRLMVNPEVDVDGALGFVTEIRGDHILQEKTFAEWRMMVFLAGKLGEIALLGESTLGSISDHHRWLGLATTYLSNHYRGVFYAYPATKFEQEQNEQKLEALQQEQRVLLQQLFDQNHAVFVALADTLFDKRMMTADDIAPFLARVSLPENFPRTKESQYNKQD